MKKVDVVYFIEHVARELDIACAVKYICESRWGMTVEIASLPLHIDQAVTEFQPHVIALPYARFFDDIGYMRKLLHRWQGGTYLDLSFEQFLSPLNQKYKAPKGDFVLKQIYHHAWGEFYRDYLIANGVTPEHIFLNGNPSYMLYQAPYRNYYPSRASLAAAHGLDSDRPWLFFPENYGWAFLTDVQLESYVQTGMAREKVEANHQFNLESLHTVIRWLNQAANQTSCEIIVRPRPAIPLELYIQVFQDVLKEVPASIHFIKAGTVKEWILASDLAVSSFSTTLLETAVADKPAYMLEPIPYPDWLDSEWFAWLPHLQSVEELVTVCAKPPDPSVSIIAKQNTIATGMAHGDPIECLANILHELREKTPEPATCIPEALPEHTASPLQKTVSFARQQAKSLVKTMGLEETVQKMRSDKPRPTINLFENDQFNPDEIASRTQRWGSILHHAYDSPE